MKRRSVCTAIFTLFFLLPLSSFAQSSPDNTDLQFWHETTFKIPILKTAEPGGKPTTKLTMLIFGTLRLGQNRFAPVDERIGAGLSWNIRKGVSLATTYLYRAGQPVRGRKEFEHRLRFDLDLEKKWQRFSLKNRSRVEYRFRHSRSDSVRYRNKTTLKIPVKKDGSEIFAPFIANEPFYDLTAGRFSSNEFSAGISKQFGPQTSVDLFYLTKYNRSGSPKHINAIGLNLTFTID